jgi:hypothetical protein
MVLPQELEPFAGQHRHTVPPWSPRGQGTPNAVRCDCFFIADAIPTFGHGDVVGQLATDDELAVHREEEGDIAEIEPAELLVMERDEERSYYDSSICRFGNSSTRAGAPVA